MDNQLQTNSPASDDQKRVPITDYLGAPNVPPLNTQPPQREIKRIDRTGQTRPDAHSAIYIAPHVTSEAGKLVVAKDTWFGLSSRVGWILLTACFLLLCLFMFRNVGVVGVVLIILVLLAFIAELVRFSRDKSHRIIFDHSADAVIEGNICIAHIHDIAAINLDRRRKWGRQPEKWRVALVLASDEIVEIDSWYYQAEATHIAQAIAEYVSIQVERTESL